MTAAADPDAPSVPTWRVNLAVRASTLPPPSRHIMLTLSDIADNLTAEIPPQRNPSTAQLARETGWDARTVRRHRQALEESGWIVLRHPTPAERARHVPIKYRLAIPSGAEAAAAALREDTQSPRNPRGHTDPSAEPEGTQSPVARGQTVPTRGDTESGREGTDSPHARGHRVPSIEEDDVPTDVEDQKPPAGAGAGGREERLRIADELADRFWAHFGAGSAQRRPAVTAVIRTAVADNGVPRNACAHALNALATSGRPITPASLTAELRRLQGTIAPLEQAEPPPPAPRPPRRWCQVPAHSAVELTEGGICRNCAADARAARDEWDEPAIQPPRRAPGHHLTLITDPESRSA